MRSFRDVLLVDGYNIINAWPSLRETARHSLEDARIELIDKLQEFQAYERIELILVFDAHMIKGGQERVEQDRKSTRLNSSHVRISYAVFCLKKKKKTNKKKSSA